jgi:hypothetical protein
MKRLSPVLVAGILLAFLSFHACDRNPVDVDAGTEPGPEPTLPDFSGTCDSEGGTVQRGTVSGTWTRNQSPHRVAEMVYVGGELIIEAGALVCLGPGASISWQALEAGNVVAAGTAEAPVVFTADRPDGAWGGFVFRTLHATGRDRPGLRPIGASQRRRHPPDHRSGRARRGDPAPERGGGLRMPAGRRVPGGLGP